MTSPLPPRQGMITGPRRRVGPEGHPEDILAPLAAEPAAEAFTHAISHDLRAPLRAIEGYARALVEDYGDRLPDEAREFVRRIRLARRTAEDRVDALLRLSRLGRGEVQHDPCDLAPVATAVLDGLRRAEPTRRIASRVAERMLVLGDVTLLGIALENLISNAWKFTRGVPSPLVTVDADVAGEHLVVTVRDNGVGFDMRQAHRLGVPFQRLHPAEAFEGLGIGLASARRIIERHGGRLWAESTPGQGAAFHCSLPTPPPS